MAEGMDDWSVAFSLSGGSETDCDGGRGEIYETSDVEKKQAETSTGENLLSIGSSDEEGLTVVEELRDGEDSAHESTDLESNTEPEREYLSTRSDDDQVRLIVTATQHETQERMNSLEVEVQKLKKENLIHQVEFGRRSFLKDKQKRSERVFQTSREYFLKQNRKDSASHLEEKFPIGAGLLVLDLLEPRSCPPIGQGTLDTIPEPPVIPSREHHVDPLPVRHDNEPPDEIQLHCDQENDSLSGVNEANASCKMSSVDLSAQIESSAEEHTHLRPGSNSGGLLSNESSSAVVGSSTNSVVILQPTPDFSGGEECLGVFSGAVSVPPFRLPVDQSVSNVSMHSNEWERLGARPKDRQPRGGDRAVLPMNAPYDDSSAPIESSAEEHTPFPKSNVGGLLSVDWSLSNISMHSNEWWHLGAGPKDRQPMQTLPAEPSETSVTGINNAFLVRHSEDWPLLDSILQGSEKNVLSYDTSFPGALDCHVSSWPAPLEGGAVGGSSFSESLDHNTGIVPSSTSNIGCQPSASSGNLALVDTENSGFLFPFPVSRSRGADRGLLSEEEGSGASQYAVENGDQQSTNVGTHSAQLPDLRHGVQDLCALVEQLRESEEQEGERERRERETQEAITPEQAVCRPFELPLPCTIESLDHNHNCAPEFWQGVARARAQIEELDLGEAASASIGTRARRWCTCANEVSLEGSICRRCFQHRYLGPSSEPDEHCCTCCACLEMNDGSQTGGGRSRPDSQHDECCICLQLISDHI